jgi:hypothetical protein
VMHQGSGLFHSPRGLLSVCGCYWGRRGTLLTDLPLSGFEL